MLFFLPPTGTHIVQHRTGFLQMSLRKFAAMLGNQSVYYLPQWLKERTEKHRGLKENKINPLFEERQ